jgi:hypothetical protein
MCQDVLESIRLVIARPFRRAKSVAHHMDSHVIAGTFQ